MPLAPLPSHGRPLRSSFRCRSPHVAPPAQLLFVSPACHRARARWTCSSSGHPVGLAPPRIAGSRPSSRRRIEAELASPARHRAHPAGPAPPRVIPSALLLLASPARGRARVAGLRLSSRRRLIAELTSSDPLLPRPGGAAASRATKLALPRSPIIAQTESDGVDERQTPSAQF